MILGHIFGDHPCFPPREHTPVSLVIGPFIVHIGGYGNLPVRTRESFLVAPFKGPFEYSGSSQKEKYASSRVPLCPVSSGY
jgi:hypothetical protein